MTEQPSPEHRYRIVDIDNKDFVTPEMLEERTGIGINLAMIGYFLDKTYPDASKFDGSVIGIYGAESKHRPKDIMGYVSESAYFTQSDGISRPLLFSLRHFPGRADKMNATLRHEISHLGDGDHESLYNSKTTVTKVKIGALALSLACGSIMPDLFRMDADMLTVLLDASLVAAFGSYAYDPDTLLGMLDSAERKADRFARKHKDFMPITKA